VSQSTNIGSEGGCGHSFVPLCVWQELVDVVGKIVQQYLGDLEWKDKKFILNLVEIEELESVWAGYRQSYNLGRLIWLQNIALERESSGPVRRLLQWQRRNVKKARIKVMLVRMNKIEGQWE
jgi:hypothetical protein